jgi:hypothetical protein
MEIYSTPRKRKTISPILVIGIIVIIGIITFFIFRNEPVEVVENIVEEEVLPQINNEVIGKSVEGREIESFTFGDGNTNLLFVGGIHGGYEWNSVILAYEFIDYLTNNPEIIPENLKISIIPVLNPDGLFDVIGLKGRFTIEDVPLVVEPFGLGRFNANDVDLNRNFDCKWQPTSSWRGNVVDAGTSAFSEPEALALKNYVEKINPSAAIFWHSQANTVYASECENGVIPETIDIMNLYSEAAGYNSVVSFDAYEVTGDAEGWLASIGIPAITVEMKTHETIEFQQNLAGFKSLLNYYKN